MKHIILSFAYSTIIFSCIAQVGIGTNSPNASAQLDVTSTNKGFLPPRVVLTGRTDAATIASPATGLLVYNTADNGTAPNNVTPGFYYNAGTPQSPNWVRLIIPTDNAANVTGTVAVANGGTGLSSITEGQIPFGNGTSALATSSNLTWNNAASRFNVQGSTFFRTNGSNIGLMFDGTSPSGSLQVSRIYTEATSGTPSDLILGTYPSISNQVYLKQSNGFVGIRNSNPTTALDVNGTISATSLISSGIMTIGGVVNNGKTVLSNVTIDATSLNNYDVSSVSVIFVKPSGTWTNIYGLSGGVTGQTIKIFTVNNQTSFCCTGLSLWNYDSNNNTGIQKFVAVGGLNIDSNEGLTLVFDGTYWRICQTRR